MTAAAGTAVSPRARALHDTAIVWDNHACLPLRPDPAWMDRLDRHHDAGATFVSVNLGDAEVPLDTMIRMAAGLRAWIARRADRFLLATTADDVRRAKREGRTAVAFDVEGARAIGDQLSLVPLLYDLGVRWMLIAYNRANQVGGGCHDAVDEGLTAFGRRFLNALDHAGMVTCCSHTGPRTAREVLDRATRPVIFSHSNARALHDHPRNITDDLIRRCAATGGVVGLNGLHIFLGRRDDLLGQLVAHIDHVVQVAGIAHAGLGLDYVYDQQGLTDALEAARGVWPPGFGYEPGIAFVEPEALPRLTDALLSRGYGEPDVRAILGENWLRVADAVWAPSASD